MNGVNEWYNAIANIGFPIAIAVYLLIRFEKRIDGLREDISRLENAIRELRRNYDKWETAEKLLFFACHSERNEESDVFNSLKSLRYRSGWQKGIFPVALINDKSDFQLSIFLPKKS